jgi:hypothetical protein
VRTAKYITVFFSALFIGTVLIERIPGVLVATDVAHEWLMFGLFKISLLDDITHGVSGVMGVGALLLGYRWTVKYLMLIGGYYSLDALFYLVNGFAVGKPVVDNLLLNVPHVAIGVLVFIALRSSVQRIALNGEAA